MRKTVAMTALIAIVGVLAMTSTSSASSYTRQQERSYTMSNGMVASGTDVYWSVGTEYQPFFPKAGERSVVFTVADAASPNAMGHVHYVNGHGKVTEAGGDFCGESKPFPVKPGKHFEVAVLIGECPSGGDYSVPTEGTITATFTK